jgi:hypothetical protein
MEVYVANRRSEVSCPLAMHHIQPFMPHLTNLIRPRLVNFSYLRIILKGCIEVTLNSRTNFSTSINQLTILNYSACCNLMIPIDQPSWNFIFKEDFFFSDGRLLVMSYSWLMDSWSSRLVISIDFIFEGRDSNFWLF